MKKYLKKCVLCLCAWMMVITIPQTYHAQQTTKVRVGIFEMEDFHSYDEEEKLTGYCVDYLTILSKLVNLDLEYIEVENFIDGCNKLATQEIDLIAPAVSTDEGRENYVYSQFSLGVEYTALLTNADRTDLYYEDFTYFDGMKIAVLNGHSWTDYFI